MVLVGGQSRDAQNHQTLKEYFGIAPSKEFIQTKQLHWVLHFMPTLSDESVDGPFIDVTPFDLGIDIAGGLFEKIIQRNTTSSLRSLKKFLHARGRSKL